MSTLHIAVGEETERRLAEMARAEGFDAAAAFLEHALRTAREPPKEEDAALDRRALDAIARIDGGQGVPLDDACWARREGRRL